MKTRVCKLTVLLALMAALLAGCSQPEPAPQPTPEPTPVPSEPAPQPAVPEQPKPAEPVTPEPGPVTPEPEPAPPEEEDPAPPGETGPTLLERMKRAYVYAGESTSAYIEFKTVNGQLFAEVAYRKDDGKKDSYWLAELTPVDREALHNTAGEPCLLRSREISSTGAYMGEEEVVSLTVVQEGIAYQKGDVEYLLTPAKNIEDIHDEADLRRYLQLVEEPLMDREEVAAAKFPGVWESVVNENGSLVSLYLELEEDGLFWLMRKGLDKPAELYRGAYGISADGSTIHYSAERLSQEGPYLGQWKIAGSAADGVVRLADGKNSEIKLCTGLNAAVEFYPAGADLPQEVSPGTVFTYNGKEYDVVEYAPAVNAIMDTYAVGKHIVVECHVGPKNGIYLIFNTQTEKFEQQLAGNNLIWHSNDIDTAVFAFWGDIYTYSGKLIGSVSESSPEGSYVRELSFSEDHRSVNVLVETLEGGDINVTFPIS